MKVLFGVSRSNIVKSETGSITEVPVEDTLVDVIAKIRQIQKRPDGIFGTIMTRPVSPYVTYFAYRNGISANIISVFSMIFCASALPVFFIFHSSSAWIAAALLWWLGAIFDASDGDLARFTGTQSLFGGWLDSIFDRVKEFLIFTVFGYIAYQTSGNFLWLIAGSTAAFTCVFSGYISDTKKLLNGGVRKPQVQLNGRFLLGMVDTRDFFIILSLFAGDVRIAIVLYCTLFALVTAGQFFLVIKNYGMSFPYENSVKRKP
jgi:phosphatidylglycerophosphate synthase